MYSRFAENICAMVRRSGSIIAGESPSRPPRFNFVRHGYLPVRREYLEGVDKAEEAWASVKAIPCSGGFVNIRSMDFRFGIKGRDVSITQIIRQYKYDIGCLRFYSSSCKKCRRTFVISLFIY